MLVKELESRVEASKGDFNARRFKSSEELLKKYGG